MPIDYSSTDYAIYRLSNRLHYLENHRPEMFDVFSKKGKWECRFFGRRSIQSYEMDGKTVKKADIDKEIASMKLKLAELAFLQQADAIKLNPYQCN
jgi:hypothetical protein